VVIIITVTKESCQCLCAFFVRRYRIALHLNHKTAQPAEISLHQCVAWTWRVKLGLSGERDLFAR
jgi:hypothetical protein